MPDFVVHWCLATKISDLQAHNLSQHCELVDSAIFGARHDVQPSVNQTLSSESAHKSHRLSLHIPTVHHFLRRLTTHPDPWLSCPEADELPAGTPTHPESLLCVHAYAMTPNYRGGQSIKVCT